MVSRLWRSTIIFWALADISTTSPLRTWYDGIVTRLPLTSTWPWRTNWRAWLRLAAKFGTEHHVVEAQLEHPQQVLAGDALLAARDRVDVAELLLEHAVDAAGLLLLAQLEQVLALADAAPAVLARRVRLALDRALHGVALGALEEQLHPLAAAEPADGSGVPRHRQTLRRLGGRQPLCGIGVTSLMPTHLDAGVLDGADGGLATRARALHHHVDLADAVLHRATRRGLGRELRGERRATCASP